MHNYKELKIWQKAIELAEKVYQSTQGFPSDERFGLTSQLRRASVSVSSNIAEGAGRNTKGEFNQMLGIAYGSLCEIETQLIIAKRLELLNMEMFEVLTSEIDQLQKMIFNLKKSLK
ncbi:four helix bundle protein [Roseivirga sp. 4D4]|uniref:four helix bundle protein n=1 Tax=Roseivirga sp. 4D4 TaxID=1889784 RepID=UPI000852E064|nr:four helix bundle protein [Roseivirga sp. 4D4]OEK02722.1 four helix bundle protein [Roseivirga sp. 4D4]